MRKELRGKPFRTARFVTHPCREIIGEFRVGPTAFVGTQVALPQGMNAATKGAKTMSAETKNTILDLLTEELSFAIESVNKCSKNDSFELRMRMTKRDRLQVAFDEFSAEVAR